MYRRVVAASLERVWENVLDWEHLPWLHRTTFRDVRLRVADREGWRAEVVLAAGDAAAEIDVRLDRPRLRYLTRTVGGAGRGTEILTTLDPVGAHATGIVVAFAVPGVEPAHAPAIGAAYVRAYTRLWDEDETMMQRRQTILDRPVPRARGAQAAPGRADGCDASNAADAEQRGTVVRLGPVDALRGRLPLVIDLPGRRVRLVAVAGEIVAHDTTCPHLGGPLDEAPVEDGVVRCPWHGYRFRVRTGENPDGKACRLPAAPRIEVDPATGEALLRPR